jgi:acyl carrier protein
MRCTILSAAFALKECGEMTKAESLSLAEEPLELDSGSLKGDETLESIGWDSLAALGFIAAADARLGLELSPKALRECRSIPDLVILVGDRVAV